MFLKEKIASRLKDFGKDGLPVMVDGERLLYKQVQVRINCEGDVFIQRSNQEPELLSDDAFMSLVEKATGSLRAICAMTSIPFNYDYDEMSVEANSTMNLAIVQSEYYYYVNQSFKNDVGQNADGFSNYLRLRPGVDVTDDFCREVDIILQAAKPVFLWKYANFFFFGRTRALLDLKKSQSFYHNSQDIFVPVFVSTRLYPTLLQLYPFLEQTVLYQTAIEKGRRVYCTERYEGYMLTQKEICKALGLRKLIRMKPEQWARVFLGAVLTDTAKGSILYRKFPNESDSVYRATRHNDFFSTEMTPEAYEKAREEYKDSDLITMLDEYRPMTTLHTYCYKISEYVRNSQMAWDVPPDGQTDFRSADAIYGVLAQIDVQYKVEV